MIEKIYHSNIKQKKTGVTILKSNKGEFGAKKITRDRRRHIMIKWPITITHSNSNCVFPSNKAEVT